jgi:hypothetical protein
MKRLPQIVGLTVCRRLAIDLVRKELNLVGICHSLRFSRFPALAKTFTLYAALYNGVGEGTMELLISRLETEERTYRYRRWLAFEGKGQFVHLEIPVAKCTFPAPGRYLMELRFNEKFLSDRIIDVKRGMR